jgi:hypothetical protein
VLGLYDRSLLARLTLARELLPPRGVLTTGAALPAPIPERGSSAINAEFGWPSLHSEAHVSEEGIAHARRIGRAVVCGHCGGVAIAEAHPDGVLTFPLDAHQAWNGWMLAKSQHVYAPGGTWKVASAEKRPALHGLLEVLPAIIECPGCGADNLFDPRQLEVRAHQLEAKIARQRETTIAG